MKKKFMEPTIRKIELNLRENIAASGGEMVGVTFAQERLLCPVQDTGKNMNDISFGQVMNSACVSWNANTVDNVTTVSLDEARMYMKY